MWGDHIQVLIIFLCIRNNSEREEISSVMLSEDWNCELVFLVRKAFVVVFKMSNVFQFYSSSKVFRAVSSCDFCVLDCCCPWYKNTTNWRFSWINSKFLRGAYMQNSDFKRSVVLAGGQGQNLNMLLKHKFILKHGELKVTPSYWKGLCFLC